MNALAWNCRGLGRPCTVHELVRLVRMYSPRLVFLSATRQDQERVQGLRWRLGLKNCLALKGEGSGGGVALIWDETLSVHLLSMSCRYIDVLISEANSGFQWRGTFVYGEPRMQDRHLMWELIRRIAPISNAP